MDFIQVFASSFFDWWASADPAEKFTAVGAVAAVVGVAFSALDFFGKIVATLGRLLRTRLVGPISGWIRGSLFRKPDRYRTYYLLHAIELKHQNLDFAGLSTTSPYPLELLDVFVDVSLSPEAPHAATGNPIEKVPEALQAGRHSIWRYLEPFRGHRQHLVVLGAPGSGKTTLLKQMALSLASRRPVTSSAKIPHVLPVLLALRDHATAIEAQDDYTLVDAIISDIKHLSEQPPSGWVKQMLDDGCCLILLDGLDEIADPSRRRRVVKWVDAQMTAHGHLNNFVVSSRPFGYRDNPLPAVTVLAVRSLTARQIKSFVHKWCLANDVVANRQTVGTEEHLLRRDADDLLNRLWSKPTLSDLAVNPLLLTMIVMVHRSRGSLPERRVDLYREICEVFLGNFRKARGLQLDLSPSQCQAVLESLAFYMMQRRIREIDEDTIKAVLSTMLANVDSKTKPAKFLDDVHNNSGLLMERESGLYAFVLMSFQEFLAAAHIKKQRLQHELMNRTADSWWHETIRLYAAQTEASPIIEACLGTHPIQAPTLVLAIECQQEATALPPALQNRLAKFIYEGLASTDPEKSRVISEALLELRMKRLIRIDEDRYIDASLITNAEYQLFLNQVSRKVEIRKPVHWSSEHYPQGRAPDPILGVRYDDAAAFCEWLTEREEGFWVYRLPRPDEVAASAFNQANANGYWTSTGSGEASFADSPNGGERQPLRLPSVALDLAPEKALGHALDAACDLAGNVDRALAHRLASDIANALDRALELSRDLDHILSHAFGLIQAVNHDLDHLPTEARDVVRDVARFLKSTRTLEVASSLERDLGFARDLSLDMALRVRSDRDLASTLASNRKYALRSIRSLAVDHALDILFRDGQRDFQEVTRTLGLLFKRGHHVSQDPAENEKLLLCSFSAIYLFSFQIRITLLLAIAKWPKRDRKRYGIDFDVGELTSAEAAVDDALRQVKMLQQRVKGEVEPFEGIRIFRERRKEDQLPV